MVTVLFACTEDELLEEDELEELLELEELELELELEDELELELELEEELELELLVPSAEQPKTVALESSPFPCMPKLTELPAARDAFQAAGVAT